MKILYTLVSMFNNGVGLVLESFKPIKHRKFMNNKSQNTKNRIIVEKLLAYSEALVMVLEDENQDKKFMGPYIREIKKTMQEGRSLFLPE